MPDSSSETMVGNDLRDRIEVALESIRPALHIDGGDVEYVDFDQQNGVLQLRLVGACGGCPISWMTVKHGIERRVTASVPEVREVQTV